MAIPKLKTTVPEIVTCLKVIFISFDKDNDHE